MNREIIRRWNERVKPKDTVYHLGDFCFSKRIWDPDYYKEILNGQIIIIKGNHDDRKDAKSLISSATIHIGGYDIFLSHEPTAKYKLNFCGHVHDKWQVTKRGPRIIVNVGVDMWEFRPIEITEILKMLTKEGYL